MSEKKLTIKQKKFIKETIKGRNGTAAAIAAGYSEKTARFIASENLTKPNIVAKIEKVMSAEADKLGITAEYILSGLKKWADTDNEKLASTSVKSLELLGKHRKLFHDGDLNVKLSEEERHKETQKQIEELG